MKGLDYLDLPELVMNQVSVKMSQDEKRSYQTMKRDMVLSIKDKEIDAANAAYIFKTPCRLGV